MTRDTEELTEGAGPRVHVREYVIYGVCRICGCTDETPCEVAIEVTGDEVRYEPCSWLDHDHSLCSNPRCVAMVPLAELFAMLRLLNEARP